MLFLLVAFLYSSVGFGGGSGYLAILSLSALAHEDLRFIALCCNILVVSINTINHIIQQTIDWKRFIILISLSIPLSFLGGYISLKPAPFYLLLGLTLLFSGCLMLYQLKKRSVRTSSMENNAVHNASVGGVIGLLSGMVGIGGGIFLSPYLHLRNWATETKIAAAASLFILVNSIAGITGQMVNHGSPANVNDYLPLISAVGIGSILGNTVSLKLFKPGWIKGMTAVLVILAAVRLLLRLV
ncbi:MAG: sulfite exporter TauE/SafE family protein [Flavobacteriales bacterium]|nr:sulfite exporter TauE/SafE family protein [Bacteroidota bacterium]MCB9240780.1 sulfite exporter TauE/SafE family protein [Flavobacteriales bacterium]